MEKIKEFFDWLVYAGWYKGGDMGDGIVVSLLSGCLFLFLIPLGIIYSILHYFLQIF